MRPDLPAPNDYVIVLFNPHGRIVVIGHDTGKPFVSEAAAEEFMAAYLERYPGVQGIVVPLIPGALDFPDE